MKPGAAIASSRAARFYPPGPGRTACPGARLMLRRCLCTSRRSRTLLGPFRQEPVASLSHSVNARRAAARAGLRCSRSSAYARGMKLLARNLTWNSIIHSSSSGAPISNPGEPAEPFSGHNRKSCASLPSQRARAASQAYSNNDPSSARWSPAYREGPSPLL